MEFIVGIEYANVIKNEKAARMVVGSTIVWRSSKSVYTPSSTQETMIQWQEEHQAHKLQAEKLGRKQTQGQKTFYTASSMG